MCLIRGPVKQRAVFGCPHILSEASCRGAALQGSADAGRCRETCVSAPGGAGELQSKTLVMAQVGPGDLSAAPPL